jgi:hypothetical protein
MVWTNPVNGRGAIYLASHAYAVEGMEAAAGKKLIDELMEAATAAGTSYLHQWREGDVVMWDNRATMHRGRPWPAQEPRRWCGPRSPQPRRMASTPCARRPRRPRNSRSLDLANIDRLRQSAGIELL